MSLYQLESLSAEEQERYQALRSRPDYWAMAKTAEKYVSRYSYNPHTSMSVEEFEAMQAKQEVS